MITEDHRPELPAERKRIDAMGGRVLKKTEPTGAKEERYYVLSEKDKLSLPMSRSIGDYSLHRVGVTCEPGK
jgi:hypothetical protein